MSEHWDWAGDEKAARQHAREILQRVGSPLVINLDDPMVVRAVVAAYSIGSDDGWWAAESEVGFEISREGPGGLTNRKGGMGDVSDLPA
jgi:hypothetical protein